MSLLRSLNEKFEEGIYKKFFNILNTYTFNSFVNALIKEKSGYEKERKGPPWVSEFCQMTFIVAGLIFYLLIRQVVPSEIACLIVLILFGYRLYEINVFTINWILDDKKPLYSYSRSLICYILNLFEIVLYVSLLSLIIEVQLPESFGRFEYFYKHLQALLTFNIPNMNDDLYFQVLSAIRLFTSALLISVIIAGLVGRLSRPVASDQQGSTSQE